MIPKIGHARGDERGKLVGGKRGDQTGGEVAITNWYLHRKKWRTFRAKDPKKAKKIAQCSRDICGNPKVGYSQSDRLSLYNTVKDNDFKCDKENLKIPVNCDCSSKIRVCAAFAGIELPNFSTANEAEVLLESGEFEEINAGDTSVFLKEGDIQVTWEQGHTVVVLSDGSKATQTKPKKAKTAVEAAKSFKKSVAGTYKAKCSLNVRNGAGTKKNKYGKNKNVMVTIPKNTKVKCFGYYTSVTGRKWLYVQFTYKGVKYTGFCTSKYLKKV